MHGKLFARTLLVALCVSALTAAARAQGDTLMPFIEGRVTRVVDGDTVIVNNVATGQPVRVHLAGTEAPETAQPGGAESRRRLESLLGGGMVRVEFKFTDKYGQVLGRVFRDGEDINHSQIAEGMAWFRTGIVNELGAEDRKLFEQAEREARAARRGLWKENAPVAPWEYRRANRISEDPLDEPPAAPAHAPRAVRANRRTKTYFTPGCPGYDGIPARLRARFNTPDEAARAGYKPAPGCER